MRAVSKPGFLSCLIGLTVFQPAAPAWSLDTPTSAGANDAAAFLVVDCLLPGQVRRLGRQMTFVTPRRAVRTGASDCEIRGGEYVAYDRANYDTALAVWLPDAQRGDAKAQTYVGEIYEKGLGRPADYAQAADWYGKAAAQNYGPALVDLAHLKADGLAGPQDSAAADALLLKASGLPPKLAAQVAFGKLAPTLPGPAPDPAEVAALRAKLAAREAEILSLQSDNSALSAKAAANRAEIATLSGKLDAERATLADQKLSAEQAEDAGQARTAAEAELARRSQELAAATAERDEARARAATERDAAAARVAALQKDVAQAQADRAALADQKLSAEEAGKARTNIEAELARRSQDLAAANAQLVQARAVASAEHDSAATRVQSLQAQVAQAQAERDRLAGTSAADKQRIATLEASIAAREKTVNEMTARLDSLQSAVAAQAAAGPHIDLIEPALIVTRGGAVVVVPPAIDKRVVMARARAGAGLAMVSVNGQRQTVDGSGLLQVDMPLAASSTSVEIVAVDRNGKRAALTFAFLRRAAQPVLPAPETAVSRVDARQVTIGAQHALLIGNARYSALPGLKTPAADVDAIAKLLEERYGFTVTVLHDATRYQILSALNAMRTKLTDKDDLLIYYAGHGEMVQTDVQERGYWLPIDAERDNRANWVSTADVTDAVATMNARKVLLIVDSCYSGLLTRGLMQLSGDTSSYDRAEFYNTIAKQKSRDVFTSGGNVPVMDGGGGVHSVFAQALIQALTENRDVIQGQDLAQAVQQAVTLISKSMNFDQLPQYAPLRLAGHESGDYLFVPRL